MRLGVLRLREKLQVLQNQTGYYEEIVEEMINNQLLLFQKMYLKDREIKNIIIVDDYVSPILHDKEICKNRPGYIERNTFMGFVDYVRKKSDFEISELLSVPEENVSLLFHSAILIKRMMEIMEAELIWAPGVTLCDGIAYEYAENNKLTKMEHDFEKDIIACARNISKRYLGNRKRVETLENITLTIFDSMKKVHALGKRERLLLQIAAILHDCGKYISLNSVGECSYSIVMATEIIGLSHLEREIVANIVMYNRCEFEYYDQIGKTTTLDQDSYLTIAKLTAILRVANGLDRSHKQKFKDIKVTVQDSQMTIVVDTLEDITLEKGLITEKAKFFEEVFSVITVIKQKRKY